MNIIKKKNWQVPEKFITPEKFFINRRNLMKGSLLGSIFLASNFNLIKNAYSKDLVSGYNEDFNFKRNNKYLFERDITEELVNSKYNNFYEFGSHKEIWRKAQKLKLRPWAITIDGMVEKEKTLDISDLLRIMSQEERVYRHRCVEAWAMTIPWGGFQLSNLIKYAKPVKNPKFVQFETFFYI